MLPDKLILLEEINTAIRKNRDKKSPVYPYETINTALAEKDSETISKMQFAYDRSLALIKKLAERVDDLENQNDHLLYFIHFLFENFSDLVKNITPVARASEQDRELKNKPLAGMFEQNELQYPVKTTQPSLTRRELEVLDLLIKGFCAKEIANLLCICETTVITHKKNLKEKFHAKNSVELISKAFAVVFKTAHSGFQDTNKTEQIPISIKKI